MRYKQSSKLARKRIVVVLDRPNTILILPSQVVLAFNAEPSESDVAILQIPDFAGRTLCMVLTIAAQDLDSVTISGKVTDQNGAVVPGTSITATLLATKVERRTVANGDGNYQLIQLSPGVYNIKASFANFATEEKTN